jgi:hypothetical protein
MVAKTRREIRGVEGEARRQWRLMVSRAGFYPALPVKQRTGRCAVTQLRNVAGGALHTIAVRPE